MGERDGQQAIHIRLATKADLNSITAIVVAGFPDDPGCNYKFPYRDQYPDDYWKWTRREYEDYLDQPEKFTFLLATAPVRQDDGSTSREPIALGIWDIAVQTESTGGDRGIHERRDVNLKHLKVYDSVMDRCFAKYLQRYGKEQLYLSWVITHPDYRRRGAGTMLCNWGETAARKKGWMLTVMSSPLGRQLYEYLGYQYLGSEEVPADEEGGGFEIGCLRKKTI